MKETFNLMKLYKKKVREQRFLDIISTLEANNAVFLTDGVYRYYDWDIYPYKGYARHIKTNKKISVNNLMFDKRVYTDKLVKKDTK